PVFPWPLLRPLSNRLFLGPYRALPSGARPCGRPPVYFFRAVFFLLATAPRAFSRARVGVRALAAHRKIAPVAHSAVALDVDEPADIHLDLLAEIAFDAALLLDGLA